MAAAESAEPFDKESDDDLIATYIEGSPRPLDPGDARLVGYGYPVWIVVDALAAMNHDVGRVAEDYKVPEVAVRAALAFDRRNRDAIDAQARANAAVFGAFA